VANKKGGVNVLDPQYVAGLFDADGYVTMTYREDSKYLKIDVGISMIKNQALEQLHKQFPESRLYDGGNSKPNMYQWRVSNNKALIFVQFITPYVVVKANDIDFYYKWYDLPQARPRNMNDSILQARLSLMEEYKKFRRKG